MAKYISKYLQLRIVRKPSYTKEVEGRLVVVPGKSIQFVDGVYETEDEEEIKFLENYPNFGSTFVRVDTKDLEKAKKKLAQTLEEREAEKARAKEEKEKKEKSLEEGAEIKKKKGEKEEKPEF